VQLYVNIKEGGIYCCCPCHFFNQIVLFGANLQEPSCLIPQTWYHPAAAANPEILLRIGFLHRFALTFIIIEVL
jgi:hypothetical protein